MAGDSDRFLKHHKATVSACFFCTAEADVCRGRRAEAEALYPSCSVTRGLKRISSRSCKNGEKGSETTDRKGVFFFLSFCDLKECVCPLHFTEESNYSLRLNRDQPG